MVDGEDKLEDERGESTVEDTRWVYGGLHEVGFAEEDTGNRSTEVLAGLPLEGWGIFN